VKRDDLQAPTFSSGRRLATGVNVVVSVLALLLLLILGNYLTARHFHRFLWAADERFMLTPQTRRVLESLTNDVRATVLFDRDSALFSTVAGLLKEYGHACPRLHIEHVDYAKDAQLAQTLVERHQLPPTESDLIIFEGAGRTRIVRASELSEYNLDAVLAGEKEVRRTAFRGEPLFTAAIASLAEGKGPVAYFLQGHGEHDPSSTDTKFGYSHVTRLLSQKNVASVPLRLAGDAEIPDDCALLVIAGPRSRLDPAELDKIGRYLSRGGRMLALLSFYQSSRAPTGLERLLAGWGVTVGENLVFDLSQSVPGGGILATNFSAHPIARALRQHAIYLVLARSVEPSRAVGAGADAPRAEPLFSTSIEGFTASDANDRGLPRHDPARDRRGAIPLAVAVEKGSLQGVTADRGSTRLVVVGESIFLANETIVKTAANYEFVGLAVNWLLDRPQHLAGIPPRPIKEYNILLSRSDLVQLRWLLLGVIPGVPLLIGAIVWLRRRR